MTPINEQKFYPFGECYEISLEGFIRLTKSTNGGIAGRLLMPTLRTGKVHYVLRDQKTKQSARHILTNIMYRELSVNAVEIGTANFDELREMCIAHNAKLARAHGKKERRAARRDFTPDPEPMVDPFPILRTGIMECGGYDDPQIDPFGAGSHFVRLDMCETLRRAA